MFTNYLDSMKTFSYLKALWSPFRPIRPKFYIGKIAIGTPYFYPRKAVNDPDKPGRMKFVPKRIGFDFVRLGWKTKWSAKDIRFEWAPIWSFVFFGYQIAVIWKAPEQDHYWECWLYYELYTDSTKSPAERIAQCREEFPCVWIKSKDGVTETRIDYYDIILRKKYRNN